MPQTDLLLALVAAGLLSIACQQATPGESAPDEASTGFEASSSATSDPAPAVEYEPAYPAEVSSEGLSTEDVAQQETTHSHDGGDAHSHDDTSHGEGGSDDDHDH